MKNYKYTAKIEAEDGTTVALIESESQEGLEEEMGKKKWIEAIKRYKEENEVSACCGAKMDECGRCMKCKEMSGPDIEHSQICDRTLDCGCKKCERAREYDEIDYENSRVNNINLKD